MSRKVVSLFVLLLIIQVNGHSKTFYVSIGIGNDSNTGTITQPWLRLDTAINRLKPGDTLYIRGGNYTGLGQITFQKNGTSAKPIAIMGYANESVIVQGFTIGFTSWITIAKLEVQGPQQTPPNWKDMPDMVINKPSIVIDKNMPWDSNPFRVDSVLLKYSTYANFFNYGRNSNPTWESSPSTGFNILKCSDLTIKSNKIHHHTYGIRLRNESKRILIENNEIHHCLDGLNAFYDVSAYKYSFGRSTISNNLIYQSFRNGIMLNYGANHNIIDNNEVLYSGQNHISTYNLDVQSDSAGYNIISDNKVSYGGYYSEFMRYPGPSAISIHSAGPGSIVDGNFISYQYDILLNDGNGIIVDFNPYGAELRNNIIYRTMGSGITSTKSGNCTIIHNTIAECGYQTTSLKNGAGFRTSAEPEDINIVIANNIFYKNSSGGMFFQNGLLKDQKYIDYNLFFLADNSAVAANGLNPTTIYQTLESFKSTGFGKNSIVADPMFNNTAQQDYHLQDNSPAAAGTFLYSASNDKDGNPRSATSPSIGAFEILVTTAIGDLNGQQNISVFPNPVNSTLIVELKGIESGNQQTFNIYSLSGKLLFSKELKNTELNFIPVQHLPSGLYVFSYGNMRGRFVKN